MIPDPEKFPRKCGDCGISLPNLPAYLRHDCPEDSDDTPGTYDAPPLPCGHCGAENRMHTQTEWDIRCPQCGEVYTREEL